MATVPTYDKLTASPSTPGPSLFRTPSTSGGGDVAAQQISQFGKAVQGASAQVGDLVLKAQQEANQLRVDDAINRLKEAQLDLTFNTETGVVSQRGIKALERPSGMSLADEYGQQFDTTGSEIASGLGNDAQRAAFDRARQDMGLQFRGQVTKHETDEYTAYQLSVREGTVAIAANEIVKRWNDPTFGEIDPASGGTNPETGEVYPPSRTYRDTALLSITSSIAEAGRLQGWSASEIQTRTLAATSTTHTGVLKAALEEGNVAFADAYLKEYSGQMTATALLDVRSLVTKEMDATVALATVEDAYSVSAPALDPTAVDRAINITVNTESGGRRGVAGPPTPRGRAYGTMQVLDTTGAAVAKKLGIPWRPDLMRGTSDEAAAYQKLIGSTYFTEQLQVFGGDVRKAWAAYNAGPGWVKAAEARAALAAPGTNEADWFWQLNNDGRTPANRKQTEGYVNKNAAEFGAGGGAPARPTLEDIIKKLEADPRLAGNPGRLRLATDDAKRRWALAEGAKKQEGEEAVAAAIRYIVANPGATYATLPSSVRAAIPPTDIDTVQSFAAKQEQTTDDPTAVIQLNDPKYLGSLTDSQMLAYRMKLTPGTYAAFVGQRARLATGGASTDRSKDPGYYNAELVNSALNAQMRAAGMDPSPKAEAGSDQQQRAATVVLFVRQAVLLQQQSLGRQLNAVETSALVSELFAKHFSYDIMTFGIDTGDRTVNMFSMKIGDIPPDSAKKLRTELKAKTGKDPSDWDVVGAYWRSKTYPAGK